MSTKSQESKRSRAGYALLLIDVINDLDFEGNEVLLEAVPEFSDKLALLKAAALASSIPVIYVNDNFEKWRSSFEELLERCLQDEVKGRSLAQKLRPGKEDYFVLKPMHSGFFCTPLEILLARLKVTKLIITGIAGNICVLYTANDAYMRGFQICVPADCIISNTCEDNEYALSQMHNLLKAEITTSKQLIDELTAEGEI